MIALQKYNPYHYICVTIRSNPPITYEHKGLVIGFFGTAFTAYGYANGHDQFDFGIYNYAGFGWGFGSVIFIS